MHWLLTVCLLCTVPLFETWTFCDVWLLIGDGVGD